MMKYVVDALVVFGVLADVYCKNGLADEIGNGKNIRRGKSLTAG